MRDERETEKDVELPKGVVRSKALTPGPSPSDSGFAGGRGEPDTETTPASRRSGTEGAVGEARAAHSIDPPLPPRSGNKGRGAGGEGLSRISAIEPQEKRKGRVSVFVDGKFAIGVFEEVALSLGLRVGQAITPERLEEIAGAETRRRALEDSYRLLSFRARSAQEIADRLTRRGYEPEIITEAIQRLRENGYVNDAEFAGAWVRSRGQSRGRRALTFELRQKGVAGDVAAQALEEEFSGDAERDAARKTAVKRVGEQPADTSREAQAKLAAYLQRRGFGWETIRPVLAELFREISDNNVEEVAEGAEEFLL